MSGNDPSREQIDLYLLGACGRGLPHFEKAKSLTDAMHGLAYVQGQILSTSSYRPHIGQCNEAVSAIQWVLDYFALQALAVVQQGGSDE